MELVVEDLDRWGLTAAQLKALAQAAVEAYHNVTVENDTVAVVRFCLRHDRSLIVLLGTDGLALAAMERGSETEYRPIHNSDELAALLSVH